MLEGSRNDCAHSEAKSLRYSPKITHCLPEGCASPLEQDCTLPEQEDTTSEQEHFPFLSLPPELRLRIYDFAVSTTVRISAPVRIAARGSDLQLSGSRARQDTRNANGCPLLRTCRQIRAEAPSLWNPSSVYFVSSQDELIGWLKSLAPKTQAEIRYVRYLPSVTLNKKQKGNYRQRVLMTLEKTMRLLSGQGIILRQSALFVEIKLKCKDTSGERWEWMNYGQVNGTKSKSLAAQ